MTKRRSGINPDTLYGQARPIEKEAEQYGKSMIKGKTEQVSTESHLQQKIGEFSATLKEFGQIRDKLKIYNDCNVIFSGSFRDVLYNDSAAINQLKHVLSYMPPDQLLDFCRYLLRVAIKNADVEGIHHGILKCRYAVNALLKAENDYIYEDNAESAYTDLEEGKISRASYFRRTAQSRKERKADRDNQILKLYKSGLKIEDISDRIHTSESTIRRVIKAVS